MKGTFFAAGLIAAASATSVSSSNPFTNSTAASCAKKCKPFTIDVTRGASDGSKLISRDSILVNGTIPGPPLKLNVGDCVDFLVYNNMQDVTSVHFHGIRQLDTPWSDGTPGLSQSAIASGASYNYRWTADEPGVYFYHSHYKGQMMDGLYGAIIISADDSVAKPFSAISSSASDIAAMQKAEANVETILTSDWNQFTFNEVFNFEQAANIDFACTDSIILNGQGSTYCLSQADLAANERPQVPQILGNQTLTAKGCIPPQNPLIQGNYNRNYAAIPSGAYDVCTPHSVKNYTYTVDAADKWAAISFISPAGFAILTATIDSHSLYVYELNGAYITPQKVDQVTMSPGDRVSFFVKLDQPAADYTIRVANDGINQVVSGFGVLSYKGSKGASSSAVALMNYGGVSSNNATITALNPAAAAPFSAEAPAGSVDKTFVLDIMKNPDETESWSWVLNGLTPYSQSNDDQTPFLYAGPDNIPASDLVLRTSYNDWVDLIVKVAGPLAEPHPIHKHANKFFVIGEGTGDFNYSSVSAAQSAGVSFNLVNPPYVDGYTSIPAEGSGSWMVFRYQANTPGAWFMHCHIQTHFSGGMAVAILDAVDKWPTVPGNAGQVCGAQGGNGTNGNGSGKGNSTATTTTTTGSAKTATGGWGDWPNNSGKPTNSAFNGDGWQSISKAWDSIAAVTKTQGNKGNTVSQTAAGQNAASTGGWNNWNDGSDGSDGTTKKSTITKTVSATTSTSTSTGASGSWNAWTDSASSSSSSQKATSTDPSSSWTAWTDGASSTSVKASSSSSAQDSASWSAWSSSVTGVSASSAVCSTVSASTSSSCTTYHAETSPYAATSSCAYVTVPASTYCLGASTGTPVATSSVPAGTGSSTWAAWSTVATPAAATGIAAYNGTGANGIKTYTGAASNVQVGAGLFAVVAGAMLL